MRDAHDCLKYILQTAVLIFILTLPPGAFCQVEMSQRPTILIPQKTITIERRLKTSDLKGKYPKLEFALVEFVEIQSSQGWSGAEEFARIHGVTLVEDSVLVEVYLKAGYLAEDISESDLIKYGATAASCSKHFIVLKVPVNNLAGLAANLNESSLIQRVGRPEVDVVGEGVEVVGADVFHQDDILGQDVKVVIVDTGFEDVQELQEAGELPENLNIVNFSFEHINFGGIHGTGCAEVVHDMAPEADLTLAKILWEPDLENAIEYFIEEDINIATMSLGWYDPTGDYYRGNDPLSRMINEAFENGVLFISSAGNSAREHYRGDFDTRGNDDDLHRFGPNRMANHFGSSEDNALRLQEGDRIRVYMCWDDFPETDQDYDLILARYDEDNSAWIQVAESANEQDGDDPPLEYVFYEVQESGAYGIFVARYDAEEVTDFTLFSNIDFGINTPEGSIKIPALSRGAFAAGAVRYNEWDEEDVELEYFSSQGPTYEGRLKPDICAPDGVNSVTFDGRFYGTSAAAPHVAGAAALLVSAHPDLGAAELRDILAEQAIDAGENGADNSFGHGLLHIESELNRDPPRMRCEPDEDDRIEADIALNQYILENALTISNEADPGARYLNYIIHTRIEEENDVNRAPRQSRDQLSVHNGMDRRRDDGGDIVAEYEIPYSKALDLAWDGELMWGICYDEWPDDMHLISLDPEQGEVVDDFEMPDFTTRIAFDGENLWISSWDDDTLRVYNRDGEYREALEVPVERISGLTCDEEGNLYLSTWDNRGFRIVVVSTENGEVQAVIQYGRATGGEVIGALTAIPNREGFLWGLIEGNAVLLSLDEEWEAQRISSFELGIGDETGIGLAHDGVNLWRGPISDEDGILVVLDDEDLSVPWLRAQPRRGYIPPGEQVEPDLLFDVLMLEEDTDYSGDLVIHSNDPDNQEVVIPFLFHITEPQYSIRSVPEDYETIQEALNHSWRGDTILVDPGVYHENLNFNGREVTVASLFLTTGEDDYKSETIIDGGGEDPVVIFEHQEGADAVLTGFTLRNGSGGERDVWYSYGGGVLCTRYASPTLRHLIINSNNASYGGGIYCEDGYDQILDHLEVHDNHAAYGSGIYLKSGRYDLRNIAVYRNRVVQQGGAIRIESYAECSLINCTVSDNIGNIGIHLADSASIFMDNTIVWNNGQDQISFYVRGEDNFARLDYCDIQDGEDGINTHRNGQVEWGGHNINEDPLFADSDSGDYHLTEGSPCIDAGNPDIEDPDGTRSDIGAFYFEQVPEIFVRPDSIDFGEVLVNHESTVQCTVGNLGRLDLIISDISIEGEYFTVDFNEEILLEPDAEIFIDMTFSPGEEGEFERVAQIITNDPVTNNFALPLFGIGFIQHPPEITDHIADIELDEDFEPHLVADLDQVFSDPNGDELVFTAESMDDHLMTEIDNDNMLWLTSELNWYGETEVTVIADDMTGNELMIEDVRRLRSIRDDNRFSTTDALFMKNQRHNGSVNLPRRDLTAELTFNVTINPVNDAPVVSSPIGELIHAEDSDPWIIADLDTVFTDFDGDELDYFCELPDELSWELNEDNVLTVNSIENFCGEEVVFQVIADDGIENRRLLSHRIIRATENDSRASRSLRSIQINTNNRYYPRRDESVADRVLFTITPVNDEPFWVDPPEEILTAEGEEIEFTLTAGDVDLEYEGDQLELSLLEDDETLERGAHFVDNGDGTCRYSWITEFNDEGEYQLIFYVSDGESLVELELLLIVRHVNQPPELINPIADLDLEEDRGVVEVAALNEVFRDPDGDELEFEANDPQGLTILINEDLLTVESDRNWNGETEVVVSANDGFTSVENRFSVNVRPVNDPPEITEPIDTVEIDEDADRLDLADLDETFIDPEDDSLSFEIVSGVQELNLIIDPRWNILSFQPVADFNLPEGSDVTVRATEHPGGLQTEMTFRVIIYPVDDPPGAFNLVTPENGFEADRRHYRTTFGWEESIEVDGENIVYTLFFQVVHQNIDSTVSYRDIDTLSLTVPLDTVLFDLGFEEIVEDVRVDISWWVVSSDGLTSVESDERRRVIVPIPTTVQEANRSLPDDIILSQNYPNPFNARTSIDFALPVPSTVGLTLWDTSGRKVEELINSKLSAGWFNYTWDADNFPAGVYLLILEVNGRKFARKIILLR